MTNVIESTRVAVLPRIYRIEDLYAGTLYQISVAAENNNGEGVSSEVLNQRTDRGHPLAPVQLGSETVTTTSITVNWGEPIRDGGSAVTTYQVYWRVAGSTGDEKSTEVLTRSHIITGLLPNTYYKIEVTASNVIGEGARSMPLEVQTDVPVPGPPQAVVLVGEVGGGSIAISWNAPDNAAVAAIEGYRIYWHVTGETVESSQRLKTPSTGTVIVGLSAETTYDITVTAVNRLYEGSRSATLTAQTGEAEQPKPPERPTLDAVTGNSIAVRWQAPADNGGAVVTTYRVFWGLTGTSRSSVADVTTTRYTIIGLTEVTSYDITVAAENDVGRSIASTVLTVQTDARAPSAPTPAPTAESVRGDSISLRWNVPYDGGAAITSYRVYWQVSGETNESSLRLNAPSTSTVIIGLRAKTTYDITVAAINRIAEGARSATLTAQTGEADPPDPPGQPELVSETTNSIVVRWKAPLRDGGAPIDQYIIFSRLVGAESSPRTRVSTVAFTMTDRRHLTWNR